MWQCPGCGSPEAHVELTLTSVEAADYFVRAWSEPKIHSQLVECIGSIWDSEEARIVNCASCGLRSSDPFVSGTGEFFSLVYGQRDSVQPYPAWRWEFQWTRSLVQSTSGTVFDVGAGDGAFQRCLIDAGIAPSRLYASEYNSDARQALVELGVNATGADLTELPPASHSVVCGHQVIQHLANLDGVFRAFDALTSPDGLVALAVSNGIHKARQAAAGGLMDMPPNHISTWQYSSFKAAAALRGWQLVDFKEQSVSRVGSAKALSISQTHRARQNPNSLTAMIDNLHVSPRARYRLMAMSAASRLPLNLITKREPCGGSIWALFSRA